MGLLCYRLKIFKRKGYLMQINLCGIGLIWMIVLFESDSGLEYFELLMYIHNVWVIL